MKNYEIEISGTDLKIRAALKEACQENLISIVAINEGLPVTLENARCNSIATICAHDDDDFAHLMIETGIEFKRIY